ncbi:MAG TPA: rod shape-determining protein [Candidatus Paceibacterota bacterium]
MHWLLSKIAGFKGLLHNEIGIDLGTANTLVYVQGKGVIINEPSVVAVNQKTGQVVAVGTEAHNMLGRTPAHIVAVKPLVDGVISDFEVTEEMIAYLLNKAERGVKKIFGPKVVVGVPSGITNVETRAVRDAVRSAGASEVYIVEEPMAAAIGLRLPVLEPVGSMIIDMGGGTTDIAVISLGGVVSSKNLRVAGDKLNSDISSYVRSEFKILIGEKTAENAKVSIGNLVMKGIGEECKVKGRDLVTGLPREVVITDSDVREAISFSIAAIIEACKEVLEATPPEILSDVMQRGIYFCGGGALIRGFADVLEEELKIPIHVATDPVATVARGCGIILENMGMYQEVLISEDNDLPPHQT